MASCSKLYISIQEVETGHPRLMPNIMTSQTKVPDSVSLCLHITSPQWLRTTSVNLWLTYSPTARRPRAQPTKQATVPGPYANAPGGQRPAAGFQPERVGRAGGGRAPGIEHHCLCRPWREDLHRLRELQLWGQTE